MNADLVFDGSTLKIPVSMGPPLSDQCQGTQLEVLGEIASRICYDSLGTDPKTDKRRGRASQLLHDHIKEVKNHSVYEHCNFTVRFNVGDDYLILLTFINRKGVWLELDDDGFEATVNFRVVLEWERHTKRANSNPFTEEVGRILWQHAQGLAPMIFAQTKACTQLWEKTELKTERLTEDQAWITLWLYGSRGFTHEMVRHRFAMSQRSTRYVDEDGSPYIMHPLVELFLNDESVDRTLRHELRNRIDGSMSADRITYRMLVTALQDYCVGHMGLDKTQGRKQARGASRGYLGNALASEMLYSAPISGWNWILSQRKNKLADAEIREVFTPGLTALQSSQYARFFGHHRLVPSPDGMGTVLA